MENALPAIPPKRYFTIGEVSELCGVKPYVLRYWEQEFTQLRPMKRRGNRRYYQHHEVLLIRRIRDLLYEQGFTISGARNRLLESGSALMAGEMIDLVDEDMRQAEVDHARTAGDDIVDGHDAVMPHPSSDAQAQTIMAEWSRAASEAVPVVQPDQPHLHPVAAPTKVQGSAAAHSTGLLASAALIRQELLLVRELLDTSADH
ncbi:MAG: hypothetical protein RLZZ584_4441 [Pseudomonadota bacterium]|jgi:DNA-binding transcriptional MerR regulator